ncbi:probable 28S ribosomal protein S26, mitochondrial [Microplitis mediator]|uniref:probable 28S ribosomal protein S26, mitochondrial n=1 Tax=Microplitis mediator TaxID=375433 RepID=UPI002554ECED|nr:probable 28S ribosomal protein S26, mitochondrial [Microplitis mediator]XP_057325828.1 probable 28S ribosomal protein S26, mitochondrial [Microplitis mediator]
MLRTSGTINKLMNNLIMTEWVGTNAVNTQIIRWWKRKPMWLPPAKSKLFRIRQRVIIPQDEAAENRRLNNNYNTYRNSLRAYFMKIVEENKEQFDEELLRKAEENDFNECQRINDLWNQDRAQVRAERVRREEAERRIEVLKKVEDKKVRDEKIMEQVEARVKQLKVEAKTFITRETIDQVIEEAIANKVDYNYAIDPYGNKYDEKTILDHQLKQQLQQ